MKETLTCTVCEKQWKRDLVRGRKPVVCPRCLKAAAKEADQAKKEKEKAKLAAEKEAKRSTKASTAPSRKIIKPPVEPKPQPAPEPASPSAVQSKQKVTASMVYRDYYPKPSEQFLEDTRNGSEWHCDNCKKHLSVSVPLCAAPTHFCPPNTTRVKAFERVS